MEKKMNRFTKLQVEVEGLEKKLSVATSRRDAFLKYLRYKNDSRFTAYLEEVILSEIREKEHLTDVIYMHASAPKFGAESFFCRCPFCKDDSQSSLEVKGGPDTYKCSSCGESGNRIDFISFVHDCSKLEAALFIGMHYNISTNVRLI